MFDQRHRFTLGDRLALVGNHALSRSLGLGGAGAFNSGFGFREFQRFLRFGHE